MLGDALVVVGRDLRGNPLTLSHQHSLTQVPLTCRLDPVRVSVGLHPQLSNVSNATKPVNKYKGVTC